MGDDGTAADRLLERYWEGLLEVEPLLGTAIGDERFDDRLPDPGTDGRAERERLHRGALEELGLLEVDELDEDRRVSLDILEAIARRDLAVLEHRTDRLTAVSHLWGPAGLVGELASLQRADTPERIERYRLGSRRPRPSTTPSSRSCARGSPTGSRPRGSSPNARSPRPSGSSRRAPRTRPPSRPS